MYGRGGGPLKVLAGGTVVGSGGVVSANLLPNTGGFSLGMILAYTAIVIGAAVITSQLVVQVVRRVNQ